MSLELLRKSDLAPYRKELHAFERIVKIGGKIPIMYAGAGIPLLAAEYKARLSAAGKLTPEISDMIDKSGFGVSYKYPDDTDPYSDEMQDLHIERGIAVAQRLLHLRHWDGVDLLNFGSTSSRDDVVGGIIDGLRRNGISVGAYQPYDLACLNGFQPFVDAGRPDSPFYGKRALTLVVESLSGNRLDPFEHNVYWTFGNGDGGVAWIPGKEVQIIHSHTVIDPGKGGITLPLANPNRPVSERIYVLPPGYEFAPGVTEEGKRQFYQMRDGGIILEKPESNDQKAHLVGSQAAAAFGRPVVALHKRVRQEYSELYEPIYGPPQYERISHLPSRPVRELQYREEVRDALMSHPYNLTKRDVTDLLKLETPSDQQAFLADHGITDFTPPPLTWTGYSVNNASGVMSLADQIEKVMQELIMPGLVYQADVYGIGASYTSAMLQFLPTG